MQDKILSLIEHRKLEAARKEVSKKLTLVVKYLGKPITEQSSNYNPLPDMWMLDGEEENNDFILDSDEYMSDYNKGYYFDGLKYGINLCIKALIYEEKAREIKATFNGYLVFTEESNEIAGYAPFPEWENAMNMFYEAALVKEDADLTIIKQDAKEEKRKEVNSIIKMLRYFWGY